MTSMALDFATVAYALWDLEMSAIGDFKWQGLSAHQQRFNQWRDSRPQAMRALGDPAKVMPFGEYWKTQNLAAVASPFSDELNRFLQLEGEKPQFKPFQGLGLASTFNASMQWLEEGVQTYFSRPAANQRTMADFSAFHLGRRAVKIYRLEGYGSLVARLKATSGDSLWLTMADEPQSSFELAITAQELLNAKRTDVSSQWAGMLAPMVSLKIHSDLSWLIGMEPTEAGFRLEQAFQRFSFQMSEQGEPARQAIKGSVNYSLASLRFEQPFIGWTTLANCDDTAFGAFFADIDSWEPLGFDI